MTSHGASITLAGCLIRGQVAVAWEASAHGAATSVEHVVAAAKRLGVKFDVETHPAPEEQAGVCGGFFTHPPGVEDAAAELRALLEDHEIDEDVLPHAVSQPFLGIGPDRLRLTDVTPVLVKKY